MDLIEYPIYLTDSDVIKVQFIKERDRIKRVRIVYYAEIGGTRKQIVRFDESHGFFHKDALFEKKQPKIKIGQRVTGELIRSIIEEIKGTFEEMKKKYIKNHLR